VHEVCLEGSGLFKLPGRFPKESTSNSIFPYFFSTYKYVFGATSSVKKLPHGYFYHNYSLHS
jgi:hypothetical protein